MDGDPPSLTMSIGGLEGRSKVACEGLPTGLPRLLSRGKLLRSCWEPARLSSGPMLWIEEEGAGRPYEGAGGCPTCTPNAAEATAKAPGAGTGDTPEGPASARLEKRPLIPLKTLSLLLEDRGGSGVVGVLPAPHLRFVTVLQSLDFEVRMQNECPSPPHHASRFCRPTTTKSLIP